MINTESCLVVDKVHVIGGWAFMPFPIFIKDEYRVYVYINGWKRYACFENNDWYKSVCRGEFIEVVYDSTFFGLFVKIKSMRLLREAPISSLDKYIELSKNSQITEDAIKILSSLTNDSLAKIYCEINCHRFPEDLKELNPSMYDKYDEDIVYRRSDESQSNFFYTTLSPINRYIEKLIGEKAVSKYWNTKHRTDPQKMNEDQFELWWKNKLNSL